MNKEEFRQALIEKYEKLKIKANSYVDDINATTEVLKDPKIDYNTKREFQNDLNQDKCELEAIKKEMHQIENTALIERISLVDSNTEKNVKTY